MRDEREWACCGCGGGRGSRARSSAATAAAATTATLSSSPFRCACCVEDECACLARLLCDSPRALEGGRFRGTAAAAALPHPAQRTAVSGWRVRAALVAGASRRVVVPSPSCCSCSPLLRRCACACACRLAPRMRLCCIARAVAPLARVACSLRVHPRCSGHTMHSGAQRDTAGTAAERGWTTRAATAQSQKADTPHTQHTGPSACHNDKKHFGAVYTISLNVRARCRRVSPRPPCGPHPRTRTIPAGVHLSSS